jgi:hypothetical protein
MCQHDLKTKLKEEGAKALKPSTRGLLKAIKSFLQLTNMIGKARVNIARGLFHINMFSEMPVEERIFTSSWRRGHLLVTARERTTRTVVALMTGLKVSV